MDRDDWNRRYETSELVWTAEPHQVLIAEAAGLAPVRALDLGAVTRSVAAPDGTRRVIDALVRARRPPAQ